ncbi:MAG: serine/threonine protein kinase [Candidatus Xenobia bacterium]
MLTDRSSNTPPGEPNAIGPYKVLGLLHGGGMTRLYKVALKDESARPLALKTLLYLELADEETQERFKREVTIHAGLRHPNICEVIDWGYWNSTTPYIVTELLEGNVLDEQLGSRYLQAWAMTRTLVAQILQGLQAIHAAGVIHRNLTPTNLFLTRNGLVKIMDFGLARKLGGHSITNTGVSLGPNCYISPEQLCNAKYVDSRSDLYSLGAIIYHMLASKSAFDVSNRGQLVYQIMSGQFVALAEVRPDLSPAVCEWVHKMMSLERTHRHATASEALQSLPE